jgi:hypothetical protein
VPVAPAAPVDVAVDAAFGSFKLQKPAYQLWIFCKSDVDVQLSGLDVPHTLVTPAVPVFIMGESRLSPQKQVEETDGTTGGTQAPCTSKSFPHTDAHAGRTEVKGTIAPSATGIDWAWDKERMLESRTIVEERILAEVEVTPTYKKLTEMRREMRWCRRMGDDWDITATCEVGEWSQKVGAVFCQ